MPNAPRTPSRNVRVHDDVWAAAKVKTAAEGTDVTAVIVAFLEDYTGVKTPEEPRRPRRAPGEPAASST